MEKQQGPRYRQPISRSAQKENSLTVAYNKAAALLRDEAPLAVCQRTGAVYDNSSYRVPFLGTTYTIHMPDVRFDSSDNLTIVEVLILHYLTTTGTVPVKGEFVSFSGLPGAMFYFPSFRNRALLGLVHTFGSQPAALAKAAETLGGQRWHTGEHAWVLPVLPRVDIVCTVYPADDEFPAEANMLFSDSISNFLPVEDTAFLGGFVVGMLTRASAIRLPRR